MKHQILSVMVSADWHLGATDPYRFRHELLELVKRVIRQKKKIDLFVVAGDTFDMKEYFTSDTITSFFLIMKELLEVTEPLKTQFRFIEGTRTHDAKQLVQLQNIFDMMTVPGNSRVSFIHEVTTEIFNGADILYLPEEYVVDSDLYYRGYMSHHHDFIFGHGPTDLMWYMKKEGEQPEKHNHATVFKADDLCKAAHYSYFGHFHYNIAAGIDKRFKSIGTVSRWEFDKDGKCGLYHVEYDLSTNVAVEEYIENDLAPIMPTVAFVIKENYELSEISKRISEKLSKIQDFADKTRLIVTIYSSLDNFIVMRDFVLASFGNIPNVKLMLKVVSESNAETTEEVSPEEAERIALEERPYLYDKSMRDESRIAAFIKKKADVNISLESILDVIRPKDNRIKGREE